MLEKLGNEIVENFIISAAAASTKFEKCNSEAKKQYLIKNIETINQVMSSAPGYKGSFGTGYPFYVLGQGFSGSLPVIDEQIRYNNELATAAKASKQPVWTCAECLKKNGYKMPDLKVICKQCSRMEDVLKPRKVINRLPDIDMWMVCDDDQVEEAKKYLVETFASKGMYTSDVNPVATIREVIEIADSIEAGQEPKHMLPLDIHIIGYSELKEILEQTPLVIYDSDVKKTEPYLPIHPFSLRKTWQKDDEPYNFILDYLYSLTPFNWQPELQKLLDESRSLIAHSFTKEDLVIMLNHVSPDSVKRRFATKELKKSYERRVESWEQ